MKKDNCWSEQGPTKSTVPFFLGHPVYIHIPGGPKKRNSWYSRFSGLCSDQQLSFFTLLVRASFPHYNNIKIIKFGWELFILWVISYELSFWGFARFPEFRGMINDKSMANPENDSQSKVLKNRLFRFFGTTRYTGWPRKKWDGILPAIGGCNNWYQCIWVIFSWEKWYQNQPFWFSSLFSRAHFVRQCRGPNFFLFSLN